MLKVTEAYFINPFEGHEKPLSDFRGEVTESIQEVGGISGVLH